MKGAKVIAEHVIPTPGFQWIGLKKIVYEDEEGRRCDWESAFRTTRRSECDGIAIIGLVSYPKSGKEDEVIIVSQFRPPVASAVVESPAGLVDAGEDAATAASRELREETGFSGTISFVSPIVPSDPGMSEANMRYVCMLVDGDAPENRSPKPEPEDGEHITVGRVPASRMLEALHDLAQAPSGSAEDGGSGGGGSGEKLLIDARMYALALGYHLADANHVTARQRERESMAGGFAISFGMGASVAAIATFVITRFLRTIGS